MFKNRPSILFVQAGVIAGLFCIATPSLADQPAKKVSRYDQSLAETVAFSHQSQISLSELASERATAEIVRDFANQMVRAHQDHLAALQVIAPNAHDIRTASVDPRAIPDRNVRERPSDSTSNRATKRRSTTINEEKVDAYITDEEEIAESTYSDDYLGRTGDEGQPIGGADYQQLLADNRREMANKAGTGPGPSPEEYARELAEEIGVVTPPIKEARERAVSGNDNGTERIQKERASDAPRVMEHTRRSPRRRASMEQIWTAAAAQELSMTRSQLEELGGYDFDWSYLHQQRAAHTRVLATLKSIDSSVGNELKQVVSQTTTDMERHMDEVNSLMVKLESIESALN